MAEMVTHIIPVQASPSESQDTAQQCQCTSVLLSLIREVKKLHYIDWYIVCLVNTFIVYNFFHRGFYMHCFLSTDI